jgi:hypothetical protein
MTDVTDCTMSSVATAATVFCSIRDATGVAAPFSLDNHIDIAPGHGLVQLLFSGS